MEAGTPTRVYDVLLATSRELVAAVDGAACAISRTIGDVLILVAQHTTDDRSLTAGQGFLVSDFPATQAVLDSREPLAISLLDDDVDPAEADLLRDLGFDALIMLPLVLRGDVWGLVEIYGKGQRRFSDQDIASAARVLEQATAPLQAG